ncbi:6-phospho-3-hexuloisomerase [Cryobacterium glaciale]|uniref:6-phospho-3-hexuloisomerase n=1 Tax=Cryobacterium glaciale TaxID=1259145 RepID=A0A4R8V386_9MICO|nr:6-phospho-3-hexuloisomerase [Cryobacterium glaciale]TFB75874.1 6-phospho-3-hexuloisomerase [Cryobacterium glaciale]
MAHPPDSDLLTDKDDVSIALDELSQAVRSVPATTLDLIAEEIVHANVVAAFAGGREGLVMRGLIMRLFHAGIDAHYVGEMTTPAVGKGDLLILSCGPGNISMVMALAGVAKNAGARILYLTAEPDTTPAELADTVVLINAQTMANDTGPETVLPMGSGFEIAEFVFVDLITNRVRKLRAESSDLMRSRHTNLE